ncbi:MAG: hypothetical protein M1839_000841 [Geoglossum umbratile]|nr:MAG: hypothetical protein M1839_000841 [Geoglossum umbratile]
MSADLLSEFDAFYQDPRQAATGSPSGNSTPNHSFFDDLLSLNSTPSGLGPSTNATPTAFGNGSQYPSWPYQSPMQSVPAATTAATTDQWGGFASFTSPAEHKPALAEANTSGQDHNDDQWGDFESFETAVANPASSIQVSSFPPAPPQISSTAHQRYASSLPLGSPQVSKTAVRSAARLAPSPPRSSYAQFASNVQVRSNRQRSSSLRNQVFPDPQPPRSNPVSELLFDATAELPGNDDEFGEFETSTAPPPLISAPLISAPLVPTPLVPSRPTHSPSLSSSPRTSRTFKGSALSTESLAVDIPPSPYPQAPKSPSFKERNPFAGISIATSPAPKVGKDKEKKKTNSPTPITAWPSFEPPMPAPYKDSPIPGDEQNHWRDFPDSPVEADEVDGRQRRDSGAGWIFPVPAPKITDIPPKTPPEPIKPSPPTPYQGVPHQAVNTASGNAPSTPFPSDSELAAAPALPRAVPPTNVPPPSILLSLFPPLFNLPQSSLLGSLSTRSPSVKSLILTNPSTITFLKAYLALATVAAHIIAGRKNRWKRDTHLAQGTKIGPAARGGGGMKLTGIDRTETRKEDREVAEVVRAWKEQLGPFRSVLMAVASANNTEGAKGVPLPRIPEISSSLTIRPVPESQGGIKAPQHCALCGLHRDERVDKVDIDVQDSFGEFWVGFWGHRTCRNFWEEHREKLAQR